MFFALSKIVWALVAPSNMALLTLILGLGFALSGRRRSGLAMISLSLAALLVMGFSPAGALMMRGLEERFPPWVDSGQPPTGAIVLGGWTDTDISASRDVVAVNEATERFLEGISLAGRYPNMKLVFTGGDGSLSGDNGNEADDVRRLLQRLHFDEGRVLYERQSRNTAENAAFTKALVNPKPGERWLLITSGWHMARSVGCFRAIGFDVEPVVVDYRTRRGDERFRIPRSLSEGLSRFDAGFHEWVGLVAYWLSGRTEALFPSP